MRPVRFMQIGVQDQADQWCIEQENELIEMYAHGKPNTHWDTDAVEEEVRAALKSSLRKKVASLDDDRWMFEGETEVTK